MVAKLDRRPRFARHAVGVLEAGEELTRTLDALEGLGQGARLVSLTAAGSQLNRFLGDRTARGRSSAAETSTESAAAQATEVGETGFMMTGPLSSPVSRLAGAPASAIEDLLAAWLPKRNADFLAGQLRAGRVLLWVQVNDAEQERQACGVLLDYSHQRVQVHDLLLEA